MIAQTRKEAWEAAKKMSEVEYYKNELDSYYAGYPIYKNDINIQVADLGVRLEVKTDDYEITNIWIAEQIGEKITEEIEQEAEKISDNIVLKSHMKIGAKAFDKNTIFQIAAQTLKKAKTANSTAKLLDMCDEAEDWLKEEIKQCESHLTIYKPLVAVMNKWQKEGKLVRRKRISIEKLEKVKRETKKELDNMESLKKNIQLISEALKGERVKIAFWKQNKYWYSYIFELTKNNILTAYSNNFLEIIQKHDPEAVVVDSGDFIEANGDGSILVDDMVSSVLFLYSIGQTNISDFLEIYAEKQEQQTQVQSSGVKQQQAQPIRQKLDKEHFLQSVEGKTLINIAEIAYDTAKALHPDREYWTICVSSALSILHLLHYCYGVKYRIVINDDSFSIESQDGTDVLYTYTEKE